jgi:hypothetical protein
MRAPQPRLWTYVRLSVKIGPIANCKFLLPTGSAGRVYRPTPDSIGGRRHALNRAED